MTTSESEDVRRDALTGIGTALRATLMVPTDTLITDDIPLLLTKLSNVPYAPAGLVDIALQEPRQSDALPDFPFG